MRLIKTSGNDRVVDELRRTLGAQSCLDVASPSFSLYAFAELRRLLDAAKRCRLVLPATGIRDTVVWKKLYKFQRDGVDRRDRQARPLRRLHHRRQRGPR
jgi:hypothetical protein